MKEEKGRTDKWGRKRTHEQMKDRKNELTNDRMKVRTYRKKERKNVSIAIAIAIVFLIQELYA